jgi:L-threonylcarbamoyladenylate synthase
MEIIVNPSQEEIKKAAKALKDGHLVAFPTETVYGLGADASNEKSVRRIYELKDRPVTLPLITHISSISFLEKWTTDIPNYAIKLAQHFWPGPITLILKRKENVSKLITSGQKNIGIRVPNNWCALELLKEFELLGGLGIAAPSANRYKSISPTSAIDVWKELGDQFSSNDMILDGGSCAIGIESTIIDCLGSSPIILRPGWITADMISEILGEKLPQTKFQNLIKHSGSDLSHYLPKTPLIINVKPKPGDGLIALSKIETPIGVHRLSSPNSLESFAWGLYASFRKADELKLNSIIVVLDELGGLADAIMDRVTKAAWQSQKLK